MDGNRSVIRTPDQRLRVFVSSTLDELAAERAAARQAVANLRLVPVMFELGARPYPPRELYRAYLDQSDVFIGIYWQRYGWVAPGETVSGLEDEYRQSGDKPKLIYIKLPAQEREPRLKELLGRIRQDDRASYEKFGTAAELRELIENDLAVLLTERFGAASVRKEPSAEVPSRRSNLPTWPTAFVGRKREVDEAREILRREESRLLTLTGPGGVGKTRFALQAASGLLGDFEDGVWLISLNTIRDPALVTSAIADTLGVRESKGQSLLEALQDYLRSKHMLLVLDGFEQVVSAAPLVAQILVEAPRLQVLVTSRTSLHLRGEREIPLAPLALPDANQPHSPGEVSHYEAIQLFVERAQDVKPNFTLTDANTPAVLEICQRLDGLPLAIELAAARLKILSPQALLARLDHRLTLLTDGARDLPARQQTLRNTIAWSYDLLDGSEQILFRRLAVFAGGCTLEAAETVCNPAGDLQYNLLDAMTSLVDESLLRQRDGVSDEPRFWMLETIREYGLERLVESGETPAIQRGHASFFVAFAFQMETRLRSGQRDSGLTELEAEHDNLRAALAWSQTAEDKESGLQLAGSLAWFWYLGGHWSEGRGWLEGALARMGADVSAAAQAKALFGVGMLATFQSDGSVALNRLTESTALYRAIGDKLGLAYSLAFQGTVTGWNGDFNAGRALLDESIALFRESGEKWGLALALGLLGNGLIVLGRDEEAQAQSERSMALFRELGDRWGLAMALFDIGYAAVHRGDDAAARSSLEESVAIFRELGDKSFVGFPVTLMGDIARHQRNYPRAEALYQEGLALHRQAGGKWGVALALYNLGAIAKEQGDYARAVGRFEESLSVYRKGISSSGVADCLAGLAGIAAARGLPERAVQLFGAAQSLRESAGAIPEPPDRIAAERDLSEVRARLSTEAFDTAWAQGRALSLEQAAALAQGLAGQAQP